MSNWVGSSGAIKRVERSGAWVTLDWGLNSATNDWKGDHGMDMMFSSSIIYGVVREVKAITPSHEGQDLGKVT